MVDTDAVVNGVFSFIIPGLGQVIEGYKVRGVILFLVAVVMHILLIYFNFGDTIQYLAAIIYGLIAGYDAYRLY